MSGVWKRMLPTLRRQHPLQMLLIILSTIWPSACIQASGPPSHRARLVSSNELPR